MTWPHHQRDRAQDATNSTTNGTSIQATWPSQPPGGKLLVAACMIGTTSGTLSLKSGSESSSSWTVTKLDNSAFTAAIGYKIARYDEPTTVTLAFTGSNSDVYLGLAQYPDGWEASPTISASEASATHTDFVSDTSETTNNLAQIVHPDSMVFTVVAFGGATSAPIWTNGQAVHTLNKMISADRFVASRGVYAETVSWTTGQFSVSVIQSFRLRKPRRLMGRALKVR